MQRFGAFALVAAMTAAGGCASSARYIEKKDDSGIVAVRDNSGDSWSNRRAAIELIEKHVGPGYEILDERTVAIGRTARNSLPETNETLNPRNAASPAKRPIGPAATVQHDATEYRITYRKNAAWPAPRELGSQEEPGLAPVGGTTEQTQYPAVVQPAGGTTSVFNRNSVRPASGGADCNH